MDKNRFMICNSAESDSTIFVDLDENEAKLLDMVFNQLNDNRNLYAPTISLTKIK